MVKIISIVFIDEKCLGNMGSSFADSVEELK